ncbi:MAG: hypothetical protein GF388_04355 [Candidatus Aegiribacteria sp.]|nr:hypothetical protein [Candidatus Aegiribacteria sp.]MBD3294470.1 hypothetical protein [Candidatus Fermentibacteria bacterium]
MTQYNITLDSEDVQDLFSSDEGVSKLMEKVANKVLDQQATEQIGADKHGRFDSRRVYRSGYRSRIMKTRFGRLELRFPRLLGGTSSG